MLASQIAGPATLRSPRCRAGPSSLIRLPQSMPRKPLALIPATRPLHAVLPSRESILHSPTHRPASSQSLSRSQSSSSSSRQVEGSTDISHSTFISSASPRSDFNPQQTPEAGTTTASPWQGHLSPTTTHLFKLILPLPSSSASMSWNSDPTKMRTKPQPTAFLLHPSQPLSHLSRLIAGSLPVKFRDCEVEYLALTGQEDDLDTHLRYAEKGAKRDGQGANGVETESERQDGGPHLGERERERGRFQEVSWSQATDLADFVKQSCLNEKFKIVITPRIIQEEADARAHREEEGAGRVEEKPGMALDVLIPSFASRTTYLRKRLLELTKTLDTMTKQKKNIDVTAHKGAQRLAVVGLSLGAAYWVAVLRWTFFTDAGWDVMEPVTWATGFGALLASCAFLVYHNREVSYSSLLDLSITARQQRLYDQHGLNIERWTEMVSEAKTLRKEIARIAADYDIEWKGELENLASDSRPLSSRLNRDGDHARSTDKSHRDEPVTSNASADQGGDGEGKKLDIDKTIDEAAELADESEHKRNKEKAAQRKGEVIDERDDSGAGKQEREESEKAGEARGREKVGENRKKFD